jgi:hypothetical protein
MSAAINDRRSLYVLLSLLVFFVLNPFLQNNRLGEFFLVVLMYLTLIPSLLELQGKELFGGWPFPSLSLTCWLC